MTTLKALQTKPNITFSAAGDPTQSIVGARVTDVYLNSVSGEQFRCVDATFGSQVWEGSQGTKVPNAILAYDHPNLVVAHTMDRITGVVLEDESPNSNGSTITGATQVPGIIGNALNFDGVNDVVTINAGARVATDTLGVSIWVNFPSSEVGVITPIFDSYQSQISPADGVTLYKHSDDTILFGVDPSISGANYFLYGSSSAIPFDQWVHLGATVDINETGNNRVRIWLNGARQSLVTFLEAGTVASLDWGKDPLRLGAGAAFSGTFRYSRILLDEFRMHDIVYTDEQAAALAGET